MARGNNWCKGLDEKETQMTKETGGNAFPHENHLSHRGMSLRDYFAAKAMQALIARETRLSQNPMLYTGASYDFADAMIKAREE